jgi:hypothetical protein
MMIHARQVSEYSYDWFPFLRVGASLQNNGIPVDSAPLRVGIFATLDLPENTVIPIVGVKCLTRTSKQLLVHLITLDPGARSPSESRAHGWTFKDYDINGHPDLYGYGGIGSFGLAVAMTVNESSKGIPNCFFQDGTLVTRHIIKTGEELTVHPGDRCQTDSENPWTTAVQSIVDRCIASRTRSDRYRQVSKPISLSGIHWRTVRPPPPLTPSARGIIQHNGRPNTYVTRSTLQDGGLGLFAFQPIIAKQYFEVYDGHLVDRTKAMHLLHTGHNSFMRSVSAFHGILDGSRLPHSQHGKACFANSPGLGGDKGPNAEFVIHRKLAENTTLSIGTEHLGTVLLRALCDIDEDEEIFVSYGNTYWSQMVTGEPSTLDIVVVAPGGQVVRSQDGHVEVIRVAIKHAHLRTTQEQRLVAESVLNFVFDPELLQTTNIVSTFVTIPDRTAIMFVALDDVAGPDVFFSEWENNLLDLRFMYDEGDSSEGDSSEGDSSEGVTTPGTRNGTFFQRKENRER